jgi:hypothetical protein
VPNEPRTAGADRGWTVPVAASRRVLVVAHPVMEGATVDGALLRHAGAGGVAFHVLIPATPPRAELSGWVMSERVAARGPEDTGFPLARLRLQRALQRLRGLGLAVDGEVGDPDPFSAVMQTLRRIAVDEVVVSMPLEHGPPAWSRARFVRRLQHRLEVPVAPVAPTALAAPRARVHG